MVLAGLGAPPPFLTSREPGGVMALHGRHLIGKEYGVGPLDYVNRDI